MILENYSMALKTNLNWVVYKNGIIEYVVHKTHISTVLERIPRGTDAVYEIKYINKFVNVSTLPKQNMDGEFKLIADPDVLELVNHQFMTTVNADGTHTVNSSIDCIVQKAREVLSDDEFEALVKHLSGDELDD